ncbi:ferric reductase-like transmembrane domain-containing protein [Paenalcaligenes sp. Me52]|uniref:ferredoxin reductase family protein n=1 Tax=Paenalcaligenes sp. Me52 TaxID=3392038 RepID=UPI003D2996E0
MTIKTWHTIGGITAISAVTVLLQIPSFTWPHSATLSLIAGVAALVCMAVSCILASRWHVVEELYGGLDRIYETHKWLGIWALLFATYHFVFKAKMGLWELAPIMELSNYWTRMLRQLSLVALGFIVILALNRNIPYQVWRWWHKLSGPLFLIVILHWLSFESPITLDSSAGIWLAVTCTLGMVAALYKLLLYQFLAPGGSYKIVAVTQMHGSVQLELAPIGKGFPFQAGQFGFLSIQEKGLREPHPFSIASCYSENGNIRFVIRSLGDYTQKLYEQAKVGMLAEVKAPHGRFKRIPHAEKEIWIGAGVGITPFISWLKDREIGHFERVNLIYCFEPSRAFPTLERVQELSGQAAVQLIPNPSGSDALENTLAAAAQTTRPEHIQLSFCGPKGLLSHVKKLMEKYGIPTQNIHYELFEFR